MPARKAAHEIRRKQTVLSDEPSPPAPRVVLGMLGGVGSGKSHVARRAAALGPGRVVDADQLAKAALASAAADGRLAEALGSEYVEDGAPAVAALGARAFADRAFLAQLEQLLHPEVHEAIRIELEAFHGATGDDALPLLVLDVPLLIETGLDRRCDALWFVDTPDAVRAERGAARGLTLEEIHRRESFQTPVLRKRARADRVIDNAVGPEALDEQVRAGLAALGLAPRSDEAPAP